MPRKRPAAEEHWADKHSRMFREDASRRRTQWLKEHPEDAEPGETVGATLRLVAAALYLFFLCIALLFVLDCIFDFSAWAD